MENAIWIAWEPHPRNRSMARVLDVTLHEIIPKNDNMGKYLFLIPKTVGLLYKEKPKVVFAQNPSLVLAALCTFLKAVFGYRLIIDEHNAGLFPLEGRNNLLNKFAIWIATKANSVIVTNDELKKIVCNWGGFAYSVPDPLPKIDRSTLSTIHEIDSQKTNFLFICSWSEDEPYQEVLEAAHLLSSDSEIAIYITGNYKKRGIEEKSLSENIYLLGFVSEHEYYSYLAASSAVIVLTKRDNCLNCGAYEAVSFKKPGVLSSTTSIENYFYKGYMYAEPTSQSIATCIRSVHKDLKQLNSDVDELRFELLQRDSQIVGLLNKEV